MVADLEPVGKALFELVLHLYVVGKGDREEAEAYQKLDEQHWWESRPMQMQLLTISQAPWRPYLRNRHAPCRRQPW